MAVFVVTAPTASWTNHSSLISTTGAVQSVTFNVNVPVTDTTAFTGSAVKSRTNLSGIGNWTATIECRPESAIIADTSLVNSFDSTYSGNPSAFAFNVAVDVIESTVFNASGVSWRSYLPGLYKASGTFTDHADSSNSTILPGQTEASVDFTVTDPSGATNSIIVTTDIKTTSLPISVAIGDKSMLQYSFESSGNITETGDLAATFLDDLLDTGVLTIPAAASLAVSDGNNTYTGNAFVSGLAINCTVGEPVSYTITAQGSGALAVS